MDFDKWKKILSTVNGKSDVIQKIKDELLKEDQNIYQEWKKTGFNIDHKFEPSQVTLLHLAARYDHKDIAESLIEKDAKLDEEDKFFGYTPLFFAAMYGSRNVAELLIEKGANVDEKNKSGETPLRLTAAFGKTDVAELLIEKGANVNEKDKFGRNHLHVAACREDSKMMEILRNRANIKEYTEILSLAKKMEEVRLSLINNGYKVG